MQSAECTEQYSMNGEGVLVVVVVVEEEEVELAEELLFGAADGQVEINRRPRLRASPVRSEARSFQAFHFVWGSRGVDPDFCYLLSSHL